MIVTKCIGCYGCVEYLYSKVITALIEQPNWISYAHGEVFKLFDVLEKAIEKSRDLGASYIEVRGESGFIEYIQMDDSRITALTQRLERGVAVRALVDGAWGFVTTGDIDNLDKAVSDAISMAKTAAPSRREPIELADVKTFEEVIKANPEKDPRHVPIEEKIKYMISNYYGLIREIDDWIGKILDTLKEIGEEENTLVIFTSDHGEMLGAHGMREKNIFYEESAHIPLLMRMPGKIKPGTVVSAPVQHIDYFATILDYLGAKKHASDGKSLKGLIEGTEKSADRVAVSEWNWRGPMEPNLMIVHDGWKFLCPNKADSSVMNVLYNMNDDPHEMNNLLGRNPEKHKHAAKAKEMKARLIAWLEEVESPHVKEVRNRDVLA